MNIAEIEQTTFTVILWEKADNRNFNEILHGRRVKRIERPIVKTSKPLTYSEAETMKAKLEDQVKEWPKDEKPRFTIATIEEARKMKNEHSYLDYEVRLDAAAYRALIATL